MAYRSMNCDDVLLLSQNLISCPSVSPDDAGCQDILMGCLSRVGFQCLPLCYGNVKNFWATHGHQPPYVCLAGHTDVVPTGDLSSWRFPPFDPTVCDGYLYGRGACDMKTGLAALVVAAQRFVTRYPNHPGTICFIVTSDEEKDSIDGSARVVEWLKDNRIHLDFCIIGEPVSQEILGDNIKNGARGSLTFHFSVRGRQGHVSYDNADNAIHNVIPFLKNLIAHSWDEGDRHFQKTALHITNMSSGVGANNVVPGQCSVSLNIRYCPIHSEEFLKESIEKMLLENNVPCISSEWISGSVPFYSKAGYLSDVLSRQCHAILGCQPSVTTLGGNSDGRFIVDVCSEVIEFGAIRTGAHQVDESIFIADIEKLVDVYYATLVELLIR